MVNTGLQSPLVPPSGINSPYVIPYVDPLNYNPQYSLTTIPKLPNLSHEEIAA
jgi:hypothetical protein